jgi:hypothetical protein
MVGKGARVWGYLAHPRYFYHLPYLVCVGGQMHHSWWNGIQFQ